MIQLIKCCKKTRENHIVPLLFPRVQSDREWLVLEFREILFPCYSARKHISLLERRKVLGTDLGLPSTEKT